MPRDLYPLSIQTALQDIEHTHPEAHAALTHYIAREQDYATRLYLRARRAETALYHLIAGPETSNPHRAPTLFDQEPS